MASKVRRCARCHRRLRRGRQWTCGIDRGADGLADVTELYCPTCTTPEERARREINDSTLDYAWVSGRLLTVPKVPEKEGSSQ
jgi:hypothetical protein